jgi:hypothetical protein
MQRIIASLVLSLLVAQAAGAATLTTGGLLGRSHRCCVVNTGTKPIAGVVPELRQFDGTSVGGDNLCRAVLGPGELCCLQRSSTISDAFYCAITFDGSKSAVRATLAVEASGAAQAVSEAR